MSTSKIEESKIRRLSIVGLLFMLCSILANRADGLNLCSSNEEYVFAHHQGDSNHRASLIGQRPRKIVVTRRAIAWQATAG